MQAITVSIASIDNSIKKIEKSLKWDYSSKIRAIVKRSLILAIKISGDVNAYPLINKSIKLINNTYVLDIPILIRNLLLEGKDFFKLRHKVSQLIGTVGLISNGLDFVDTTGTFFGSVLDAEKFSLLRILNTYSSAINLGIVITLIASRVLKICRIVQLTIELNDRNFKKINQNKDLEILFISTLGIKALEELNEKDANQEEVFNRWRQRKVIPLLIALVPLTLSLFASSPVSRAALILSSKVIGLATKIFEDFCSKVN